MLRIPSIARSLNLLGIFCKMTDDKFLNITNSVELADFLHITQNQLNYFTQRITPSNAYKSFAIPKKTGGERIIYSPQKALMNIQKKISDALYIFYPNKRVATGFIKGKSIKANAEVHVFHKYVLNIDLLNFFDSIHFGRVLGMFKSKPFEFNNEIATMLTRLVCKNGILPQGAPSSPIISNFICRKLDNQLIAFAAKYKMVCTRYCDDITFSTKAQRFPANLVSIVDGRPILGKDIITIIESNGFSINYKKLVYQTKANRQMVTGLVVNEKINVPKNKYKLFRAILHHAYYDDFEAAKKNDYFKNDGTPDVERFHMFLRGTINYYKMVSGTDNPRYRYLAKKYNEISGADIFPVPDIKAILKREAVFVIESNYKNSLKQGTAFLLKNVGLVTCRHNLCSAKVKNPNDYIQKMIPYISVFLPSNPNVHYQIELAHVVSEYDVAVFKIVLPEAKYCFEPTTFFNAKIGADCFTALGYPNYADGDSIWEAQGIKITQQRPYEKVMNYLVDKDFFYGASGGPVLDKNDRVVGYICRGNDMKKNNKDVNCFISIHYLLKNLTKQK